MNNWQKGLPQAKVQRARRGLSGTSVLTHTEPHEKVVAG